MTEATRPGCILIAGVVLAVVAACGTADPGRSEERGLFDAIRATNSATSRGGALYRTIAEALPTQRWITDQGVEFSFADVAVVGDVVSVTEGRSFAYEEDPDVEVVIDLPFNDPKAQISTVHLEIAVETVSVDKADREIGKTVRVGLALPAPVDVEAIAEELSGRGGVVVVLLYEPSSVFSYDPTLWAILEDGNLLGVVDSGGNVTFPSIDDAVLEDDIATIDDLAPADPPPVIEVETDESGHLARP